jgi:hypothetical protein
MDVGNLNMRSIWISCRLILLQMSLHPTFVATCFQVCTYGLSMYLLFNIFFCFHKFCCTIVCDFLGYGTLATTCKLFNSYFLVQLLQKLMRNFLQRLSFLFKLPSSFNTHASPFMTIMKPHLNLILLYNVDPIHPFIYIYNQINVNGSWTKFTKIVGPLGLIGWNECVGLMRRWKWWGARFAQTLKGRKISWC